MSQRPLFLFSLPRSGSTLVQRLLAAHADVSTTPEPWFLLPLFYSVREQGVRAEYSSVTSTRAVRDFITHLPSGLADYHAEIRAMAEHLYERASDGHSRYFVDKTPRYHFVVDDIYSAFPDAAFVFLWRNPLAVVASIVETWTRGRWGLGRWQLDLFDGLARLVAAFEVHASKSHAMRFEDLITNPARCLEGLYEYLDLPIHGSAIRDFSCVRLEGHMGDKIGTTRYDSLSADTLDKWKHTIANPLRVAWCRDYLTWIGKDRLELMGYSLTELMQALDQVHKTPRRLVADSIYGIYDSIETHRRMAGLETPHLPLRISYSHRGQA